jgi:polyisoprenoid-binding protein YceI
MTRRNVLAAAWCVALSAALSFGGAARANADLVWTPDLVHSRAEFLVSHLVVSKVWGHIAIASMSLSTDADGIPTTIAAVLVPGRLDTDNHDRDADLRSATYFDVATFPTITFKSTAIKATGKTDDGRPSFECTGDLTIKNTTKSVVLEGTIEGKVPDPLGVRTGYSATTTIDRRDFGITDGKMNPMGVPIVGNDVHITLTVEATRPK